MDLYSKGHFMPDIDEVNDWATTFKYNGTHVNFESLRKFVTSDHKMDEAMPVVS